MIIRYGTMRYCRDVVGIIGSGERGELNVFYEGIDHINRGFNRSDFVSEEGFKSGAITISDFVYNNLQPDYAAQFAEFDLRKLKGAKKSKASLERRLKRWLGEYTRRHLVVLGRNEEIIELTPEMNFFRRNTSEDSEIKAYLSASLKEATP
ncbi:hypothetical protein KY345_01405 [Candidatus Woesearchaeota archaeon]|nr:hypothetical protein [Candidatus Woesearchaeota archaeon]